MLGTITKGEYNNAPLPDNVYLAKVLKVAEKAPPANHPDWYPSLQWSFEIVVDPFKKRRAWGKTPTNWIAGKKLDNWLVTCGINVGKGTSIRIEDIKDIYVKILVKNDHYKDKETGEVLLDQYNAINQENMSIAIAQSLASLSNLGPIYEMVFGNGGAVVSDVGTVTYLTPNTIGMNAELYNQTYAKIVNNQDPNNTNPQENYITVSHISGNVFTDLIIHCTLDVGEPSGQDSIDQTNSINGTFVFSELGLKDYQGLLLTMLVFSPVQKSSNRSFSIIYTLRFQLV